MPIFWLVDTRREYDWLFNIYVPIALGVFGLFAFTILAMAVHYRRRGDTVGPRRNIINAHRLETGYAVLLACVAVLLLYFTYTAEHKVDTVAAAERPAVTIDVTASRWEWTFSYPGHNITHRSGAVGDQPLVVPANEAVRFRLRSLDVVHSFWIPQVDYKRDAIPGATERITLDFDRTGHFSGSCAEYCGLLHSEMVFGVRVISDSQFQTWLANGGSPA